MILARVRHFIVIVWILSFAVLSQAKPRTAVLDGKTLSLEQVVKIAEKAVSVEIAPDALAAMDKSYLLLQAAIDEGRQIYGANLGVGGNKSRSIFTGSLSELRNREASEAFNSRNLLATAAGSGQPIEVDLVRAMMVLRLNDLLIGHSGARREVALALATFLNKGITPVVPSLGSIGEADIVMLSHVGVALMGEGDVFYKGKKMAARDALKDAGVAPLRPHGIDSLAIMSSNSYGEALAIKLVKRLEHLLEVSQPVLALSLEGVSGEVAQLTAVAYHIRKVRHACPISMRLLDLLEGSYLLSPRSGNEASGSGSALSHDSTHLYLVGLHTVLRQLKADLLAEINSSRNHPSFVPAPPPGPKATELDRMMYVNGPVVSGYFVSTVGFEPFHWVVQMETLKAVLRQLTNVGALRILQLVRPDATGLERFLRASPDQLAFSAIQKTVAHLQKENVALSSLAFTMGIPLGKGGEDVASDGPQSAVALLKMTDNLVVLTAIELMHAAQAVDLRIQANPQLALGAGTKTLLRDFRTAVPFLDKDRLLSKDIEAAAKFVAERRAR